MEYGLDVFGGKWEPRIICVLAEKKVLRYSGLRKEMGNLTDAVLAAALKELIACQIIRRQPYDRIQTRAEYSMAGRGRLFCWLSASGQGCTIRRITTAPWCTARSAVIPASDLGGALPIKQDVESTGPSRQACAGRPWIE